ncbi:MAG: DUF2905 domain-containing protein [Nanobdellota archaeon]
MMKPETIFFAIGILALIAGTLLKLGVPLGNLPGDIRIVQENMKIYIPITTMILASFLITLVIYLLRLLMKT